LLFVIRIGTGEELGDAIFSLLEVYIILSIFGDD
jgi:hypothetical protein